MKNLSSAEIRQLEALKQRRYAAQKDASACTPAYFNNASTKGAYTGHTMQTLRPGADDNQRFLSKGGFV